MSSILKASLWSASTELISKVISPISFLILTRILSPEDFGIVAIVTSILGFVYVITDMGISKIIIQQNDSLILEAVYNAGFWFNAFIGLVFSILMYVSASKIAFLFGQINSEPVIKVMAIQVVFYSLSSVQNAIRKKELDFKFLFYLRFITTATPVVFSIPFAFMGGGYWAIVWGQVIASLLSTGALWFSSKWRPSFSIDLSVLKFVLSKSIWSTVDQIFVWIPIGLDTFLISKFFTPRDLGLYTTSRTLFASAAALTLGAIIPVLYSAFSKIQNDNLLFKNVTYLAQKVVFTIAGFLGVFVFIFSAGIERLLFTGKWVGISNILGVVFLLMGLGYFSSVVVEALRSKGNFKLLAINTIVCVLITIPILFSAANCDLQTYVIFRCLSLFLYFPFIFYLSNSILGFTFGSFMKNNANIFIGVGILIIIGYFIDRNILSFVEANVLKLICFMCVFILFLFKEKDMVVLLKSKIFK